MNLIQKVKDDPDIINKLEGTIATLLPLWIIQGITPSTILVGACPLIMFGFKKLIGYLNPGKRGGLHSKYVALVDKNKSSNRVYDTIINQLVKENKSMFIDEIIFDCYKNREWENGEYNKLWIHIGKYSKVLEYAQIKILELLMKHLLKEKIKFATAPNIPKRSNSGVISSTIVQEEIITNQENKYKNKKYSEKNNNSSKIQSVNGIIKGETDKALLIQFDSGTEVWIPKSKIHSNFDKSKSVNQKFMIDDWILEKNKVVS